MSSSSSSRTSGPLKIPLKTIQFATSNFSDVSLIKRESSSRKSYEGKIELSGQQIDIVIIVAEKQTEKTFSMEVALLYKLKHRNLVSMVGYCHELDKLTMEKIIVYKNDQRKGSLDNYLTDSALNWMQRLHICVGVARGLSYIYHNKRLDFSVIHRDIKSSKILLDEDWRPILSGFELSMSHKAGRRNVVFHAKFFGSPGYCDPTYFNNKFVSHKSDMYSFGVVLFEVLCGKTAVLPDGRLLASLVKFHIERGTLRDIIDPGLFEQMDQESFKIFTEVAHHCLEEQQSDRPNIHQIVRKLKKALESQQKHAARLIFEATASKRLEGKNFEHLKIPLSVIKSATNEFDKTHRIGGGSFGEVYEATLEHIDRKALLPGEENNISELPKKCSKVAIKLILNREDNEGEDGFYKEVEMLTNCDHLNIVYLLGFCKEDGHMILVYEYAAKGSLDKYLLGSGNLGNLSWVQRIQVCIGIARGLEYLHTKDEERIIHRDIKSGNVLLDENLVAKIGDFGLSKLRPKKYHDQVNNTLYTDTLAGTKVYMDPEYLETGNMKNESDIYSFGVVLLEMLSGRFANDAEYIKEDVYGIAPVARRYSREGKIMDLIDHRLTQETHENIFSRDKGPNQKSLDKFVEIAIQCVEITQVQRPSAAVIVERLKSALSFQLMHKDGLQIPFEDIKLGTHDFKDEIGKEQDGKVYKGELCNENGPYLIAAKKMAQDVNENEQNFWMQLQILLEYKHKNIIGLVGYCNDVHEKVIVYEYASRGSLDKYLKDNSLTWMKRLEICIGIASGLEVLHGGAGEKEMVVHRHIKSSNILLNDDWIPKITDFGRSYRSPISKDIEYVINKVSRRFSSHDPEDHSYNYNSTKYFDIHSLGVILFEILCGRLWNDYSEIERREYLSLLATDNIKIGKLRLIVFRGIEERIAPRSLATFQSVALKCIDNNRVVQPIGELRVQLEEALELQKDYDTWKPRLPEDYEKIFKKSNSQEAYTTAEYKQLHGMLLKGILLPKDNVIFSLGGNGERNVMISAKNFSSIDRCLHKWQRVPESSFEEVAEMLDILNLNFEIETRTQLLSLNVTYGVYLVFKFRDPRQHSSKPLYVNLKYKSGSKTSHTYFATHRDKDWMMIELCRFLNDKEDIVFKFLLENFSPFYCGDSTIYVEGIEYRAITKGRHEQINQELKKSDSGMHMLQQVPANPEEIHMRTRNGDGGEKLFWLREVNGKKHLMLSAKAVLNNDYNVKFIKTTTSTKSRFGEVIELIPKQVLFINCMIESEMLSRDIDYVCYLVFKLSEECHGLQYPIRVRDLLHWSDEEAEIVYFIPPRPWNLYDPSQAPKPRADGWLEVKVWKFNLNRVFINEWFNMNLRLVSYEGTLPGLIVCGLEFRPM